MTMPRPTTEESDLSDDFLEDFSQAAVDDALERRLDGPPALRLESTPASSETARSVERVEPPAPKKPSRKKSRSMSERFLKELIVRQRRRKARRQAAAEKKLDDFIRSSSQVTAVDDQMAGVLTDYLRDEPTKPKQTIDPSRSTISSSST